MKKLLFMLCLAIVSIYETNAENIFFEQCNDSTIKFYLNEFYQITDKSNAKYYRICQMPNTNIISDGHFDDYLMDGTKIVTGHYLNGFLDDTLTIFYRNGFIRELGIYDKGKRSGKWIYFYQNGQIKKTVQYGDTLVHVMEFYRKNGKQVVFNGNGKYKDESYPSYDVFNPSIISGNLKNGVMDGTWHSEFVTYYYNIAGWTQTMSYYINEKYSSWTFIKGTHYVTYETYNGRRNNLFSLTNRYKDHSNSLISLADRNKIDLFDFFNFRITIDNSISNKYTDKDKNEFDKFMGRTSIYSVDNVFKNTTVILPYYKEKQNFNAEFIPDLKNSFSRTLKRLVPNNILILFEFKLLPDGSVDSINIICSKPIKAENENQIKLILFGICNNSFKPASIKGENKNVDCEFFIPLYYNNNQVNIPEYKMDLLYENKEIFNLLNN